MLRSSVRLPLWITETKGCDYHNYSLILLLPVLAPPPTIIRVHFDTVHAPPPPRELLLLLFITTAAAAAAAAATATA
jgi:hypothetical protein